MARTDRREQCREVVRDVVDRRPSELVSLGQPTSQREVRSDGDVIAIEPGLWRRDIGEVRFEDLLLVTEDGSETLTDYPYELTP